MKILLVDDDQLSGPSLTQAFMEENYVVNLVTDAETALKIARACPYDLIVLNLHSRSHTSIRLCELLRSGRYEGSILMLSREDNSGTQVECNLSLDAGANECLDNSYKVAELLERMHVLLGQPV
jgi:DNA-binding response OmpR family regulator